MALTEEQIQEIREELQSCKRPLFFFHDDADGLASFLLLYRYVGEGKGVIIKTTPRIDEKFSRQVEEYNPDKIFIVDIAIVEQEFLDKVKQKVIWIDHHAPLKRSNVSYFNPRISEPDDNIPASALCYQVVEQDLWIAMIGAIGDWHWPYFADAFKKEYPDLIKEDIKDPETALFETDLGKLIDIVSFCLKGTTQDAMKYVKIMTRIKTPYEILNKETSAGKYIYKRFDELNKEYEPLLKRALTQEADGKLVMFIYPQGNISFTKDIANQMLHQKPDNVIIIAREKSGEMKMSLRSKTIIIPPILEKALKEVDGYGGGHEFACGANVKKEEFDTFITAFKKQL